MHYLTELNWLTVGQGLYVLLTIIVCLRIVYDTRTTTKTLAYLLLTIFLPVVGMIVYFTVGTNLRLRSMYSKKLTSNETLAMRIDEHIVKSSREQMEQATENVQQNSKLARLMVRDNSSPLTGNNRVTLLLNGETKFPDLLDALQQARHHIHIEYYIYDDDRIGNAIKDILIQKAKAGVQVRFIYDDFGSRAITKKLVPELQTAGVQAYPFYKLTLPNFAQRLNYRNHRKIVVIDGCTAYVGGINVSDRYINQPHQHGRRVDSPERGRGPIGSRGRTPTNKEKQMFWRDTHLRIDGAGCYYLQHLFLCDWNFCADEPVAIESSFFGNSLADQPVNGESTPGEPIGTTNRPGAMVQIGASGPDSRHPGLLFDFLQAINSAEEEILLTTPYFIPGDSLLDALTVAALSGVRVKLLVPGISDSRLVNAAASSYYGDLMSVGVEIYLYQKGFVHAKTMVTDEKLAVVGTANMDYRSFDLNFEVAAFVYDTDLADQLKQAFIDDLSYSERIDYDRWRQRSRIRRLGQKIARMVAPLL
ncbi:phospholipase D-like domain-containing protein [Spirosoma spitsbergense]|uniref:phospholipase D-like domain-containing protein n=1 Tax=Spirosoma spitsbergense TaxID=431554 RepID=UPI0003701985|nr:phospholipase D-like domain-containing protein [Spirosoma spitsbergense]